MRIASRRRSDLRRENSMFAACEAHSHTGENTSSTRVCEIGLGSSFRRCVTAKAVAVATSKARARIVGAFRLKAARLYAADTPPQPHQESDEPEPEPDRDHVARLGNVEQLDPAECEHTGEREPERGLREPHREAARDPDSRHGAEQKPPHLVLALEDERRVVRLHAALDERLRDEPYCAENERSADRIALGRLDAVAVGVLK